MFYQSKQYRDAYIKFGDLLFVDLSVSVKRKELPTEQEYGSEKFIHLCVFSGIDSTGTGQIFAIVILNDVNYNSLSWSVNEFFQYNETPETVISDYSQEDLNRVLADHL